MQRLRRNMLCDRFISTGICITVNEYFLWCLICVHYTKSHAKIIICYHEWLRYALVLWLLSVVADAESDVIKKSSFIFYEYMIEWTRRTWENATPFAQQKQINLNWTAWKSNVCDRHIMKLRPQIAFYVLSYWMRDFSLLIYNFFFLFLFLSLNRNSV